MHGPPDQRPPVTDEQHDDRCRLPAALGQTGLEKAFAVVGAAVRGRKLRESEGRTRYLSRGEFDRLVDTAGKELHARDLPDFITLAVHTGCLANELLGLEWSRVDLSSGFIFLEGRHTRAQYSDDNGALCASGPRE